MVSFSKKMFIFTYSFNFLLTHLDSRRWVRENERENIFYLVVRQPGKTRMKPGIRNSVWFFHMVNRDPSTWANICFFPGCVLAGRMERAASSYTIWYGAQASRWQLQPQWQRQPSSPSLHPYYATHFTPSSPF